MKQCKHYSRILVIRTDRIGDVVLTTPVFKALRQGCPNAFISVLVSPVTRGLVEGNPYINEVITDDRDGQHKGLVGFLRLAREIRRREFDAVLVYHSKRRYHLACYLAGVPLRVGFQNSKWSWLLNKPMKDARASGHKHEVRYCLDLLEAIGLRHASPELFVPENKQAEHWAADWFVQNAFVPGEVVALHPGASDSTKIWPTENFAQLAVMISQKYKLPLVIIGGKETKSIAQMIAQQSQVPVHNLAGELSLAQTASFLRRCKLLISNDSGPVHVASAVGIHVISLFLRDQPGLNPQRWAPLGPKGYVLVNKPHEAVKIDAKSRMTQGKLDSITSKEVLGIVDRIMSGEHQTVFYW